MFSNLKTTLKTILLQNSKNKIDLVFILLVKKKEIWIE